MLIVIDVAAWYDWEALSEAETAAFLADPAKLKADHAALLVKTTANGTLSRKVFVEEPRQTTINIPDQAIAEQSAALASNGTPKSTAQIVAGLIEKTMPHHAHPDHFTKITVDSEPAIEKMLNAYFNTSGE